MNRTTHNLFSCEKGLIHASSLQSKNHKRMPRKDGQSSMVQKCPHKRPINVRQSIQAVTVKERNRGGYINVTNMGSYCNLVRNAISNFSIRIQ
jgi:hypothetical protein